jgi:predicted O-methyltransferase YrrM
MDQAVTQVLAEYDARLAAENQLMQSLDPSRFFARRNEFLLPIGADTAQLLHTLIKSAKARSILEIGTSYGYSTLWLADAARHTDGRVVSLELAADKAQYAGAALARAGLADRVDIQVGNALDTLSRLAGPFEFVLIDLWKDLYIACLELVYPKLVRGAFVVADNMIHPEQVRADAARYQRRVRELEFDTVSLPIGSGIEVSCRR